jgi:hypothetical protein
VSDSTLFRARLTGVIAVDASDTTPSPEKRCTVEYIREDTAVVGTNTEEKGLAYVYLPNYVPCPLYAAKLHLFGTLGSISTPLANAVQPRVIVRRDITTVSGTAHSSTACQAIIISPTLVFQMNVHWGTATEEVQKGEYASVTLYDTASPTPNTQTGCLGYYPEQDGTSDKVSKGQLFIATLRLATPSVPATYTYAWFLQGVGTADHRHLRIGPGINGGGPAFAAFAPATVADATGLGYTL